MSDRVQKSLQPISSEQPCGPDLSYDPRFDELEATLKGKPEVDIGAVVRPAEPPDWRTVTNQAEELLGQTKHLRLAIVAACAWLKTEGAAGFRDGLLVIRGLLEQYWATVYPLLDPEDNNDPTQRLNLLRTLTLPRGSVSGWLTFADYLHDLPLAHPKGTAPVTYAQMLAARKKEESGGAEGPDLASLGAALRSVGGEQIAARYGELEAALEAAQGIDQFLTSQLGSGETISFEFLHHLIEELMGVLRPYLPGAAAESGAASEGRVEPGEVASGGFVVAGSIRSRDDVTRALDAICEYYRQVEPGSPVPFLLRRAQKLASMNFVEAVQELNLGTVDTLRPSMGSALEAGEAPPPPAT